jgi:ribonuclease Z
LENDDFRILSWPTRHFIPTIGLRIEVKSNGQIVGYSCDTEPAPNVVALGTEVDLFFHESAGKGFGHSSAEQAGESAMEARTKRLILIHYNVWHSDPRTLVEEARRAYDGPVELAEDFSEYQI